MNIDKIIGFFAPVGKQVKEFEQSSVFGQFIKKDTKLFKMLNDIFDKSESECNIQIRFIAQNNNQDNEIRDAIIKITNSFTIASCKPLVISLSKLTDNKTKDGLLFFVKASTNKCTRTFIARFPVDTGITISNLNGEKQFEVAEDIFLKNSKRYKAVYYDSTDDFWIGYAVDKQITDTASKIKELSDYWITDFLKSDLKMTSKRGSKILAKAIRSTIDQTDDENVKKELIGASSIIKNINQRQVSLKSMLGILNLSEITKNEVLQKFGNHEITETPFVFDVTEFDSNFNYLINILDTGAIIIGPANSFDDLWQKEIVADGRLKYSTEGLPVKEKISNARI